VFSQPIFPGHVFSWVCTTGGYNGQGNVWELFVFVDIITRDMQYDTHITWEISFT